MLSAATRPLLLLRITTRYIPIACSGSPHSRPYPTNAPSSRMQVSLFTPDTPNSEQGCITDPASVLKEQVLVK
jgi:hypothetical protein